jgi:16S rRNA processing protein RimM
MADELFTPVGRVVKTHGLKGEVSVLFYSDASPDLLSGLELWVVPPVPDVRTTRLLSTRPGPKGRIATLEDLSSIDQARHITGRELLVRTAELPAEWEEVAHEEDAVGMTVIDEDHEVLGIIDDIIVTGANDVWVVHGPLGEILIPVIDEVVLDFDSTEETVTVRLLPGLLPDKGGPE